MKEHECKHIGIAEKVVCQGNEHLESFFQDVIDKGGEGIILRDPQSFLQPGRTPSYLKHKVLFTFPASIFLSFFWSAHDPTNNQKYRDGEARIVGRSSSHQWECELYVNPSHLLFPHSLFCQTEWSAISCNSRIIRICKEMESSNRRYHHLQTSWIFIHLQETQIPHPSSIEE